jgi:uncharacterized protein with HEPN domain
MVKDNIIYIDHMLDCIQRIDEYINSKPHFYSSQLVQDAVVRNLQIMSESSQRIADDIKNTYPDVPWREISGFRNILVHDYLGVDVDAIWGVIETEVPLLEEALVAIQKAQKKGHTL